MSQNVFTAFLFSSVHLLLVAAFLVLWWVDRRQKFFLLLGLAELVSSLAQWSQLTWIDVGKFPPVQFQLVGAAASVAVGYLFFRAGMDFGEVPLRRQLHWSFWLIPFGVSVLCIFWGNYDLNLRICAAEGALGNLVLAYRLTRGSWLDRAVSIFIWVRVVLWMLYTMKGPFAELPRMPFPVAAGFGFAVLVAGVVRSWRRAAQSHERETRLLGEFQRAFEQSTLARIRLDANFNVTAWNAASEKLFGYPAAEAVGKQIVDLIVPPGVQEQAFGLWRQFIEKQSAQYLVETNLTRTGGLILCEWHNDVLVDETNIVVGINSFIRNVTEQQEAEERLQFLAYHDPLTGLPNRTHFEHAVRDACQKMSAGEMRDMAVFFIDVDSVKMVNDSYGHSLGDSFLAATARRLEETLSGARLFARFGGDEFSALIPLETGRQEAVALAEAVHRALETPIEFESQLHTAMVSVGISFLDAPATSWEITLQQADIALNSAKRRGAQQTELFQEELRLEVQRKVQQENALRQAIARNELRLEYQPQFNLQTCAFTGVEALLRWHPEGGEPISPSEFIPIAEESELIVEIGDWVLRQAIEQARLWKGSLFGDIQIAVNVASKQLERSGFASKLIERLAVAGVSPDVIELEITERALLTFSSQTLQAFTVLRQSGVSIALDDFGIGYSALAYLRRFPIDKIKIDRLFVREIGKPGNQADLVEAILGIARAMQIDVIAEGVDSMEQAIHLRDKGCYEVQGFLISRPLPVVLVERLLSTVRAGYDWEKKGFFRDSKSAQG